ncbi:hypothetical protein EAG_07918 [Camponotus floridanus]|uniref:Uncharacterized protein n=1 Tax=Camponotus floridanus TaxID=104421 RepID=E2ACI6_CAMFO|nr:hypothetical protein EAG_07918 [Camponotus floridanus]
MEPGTRSIYLMTHGIIGRSFETSTKPGAIHTEGSVPCAGAVRLWTLMGLGLATMATMARYESRSRRSSGGEEILLKILVSICQMTSPEGRDEDRELQKATEALANIGMLESTSNSCAIRFLSKYDPEIRRVRSQLSFLLTNLWTVRVRLTRVSRFLRDRNGNDVAMWQLMLPSFYQGHTGKEERAFCLRRWRCVYALQERGEEKRGERTSLFRTDSYQKAVNRSETGRRPAASQPSAPSGPSLSYLKLAFTWLAFPPHALSPPPGNQSRSSYFRTIQPLPPVLCGPNARDASRVESSMEFAEVDALFLRDSLPPDELRGYPSPTYPSSSAVYGQILSIFKSELCNRRDRAGNEERAERKMPDDRAQKFPTLFTVTSRGHVVNSTCRGRKKLRKNWEKNSPCTAKRITNRPSIRGGNIFPRRHLYFILNESLYQICMRYYELQRQVSPFGAGYTIENGKYLNSMSMPGEWRLNFRLMR